MNLGTIELEKKLVIKDNIAYAYVQKINKYEKIDGCDYFKGLVERDVEIDSEIQELVKRLNALELEKENNKSERLSLELAGYCPMDFKAYERIGGVAITEYLTHRKNCKHKGDK